ncbi:MAG: M23 family metallopeptidase [Cytophagales bacterium]|nr:M23 family metallopeptidase [Cytophagales bacterium]
MALEKVFKFPLKHIGIIRGKSLIHSGVDFGWHKTHNCPVYAVGSGTVVSTVIQPKGGQTVKILHDVKYNGKTIHTEYAHLQEDSLKVKKGQKVKYWQQIANMGATGKVSGEHLHLNMYIGGKKVDPLKYLCLFSDQEATSNTLKKYKIHKAKKVVKCEELNVRNKPNTKGKVVGTAKKGTEVGSFGTKDGWNIEDNIRGYYCSSKYVK